MNFFQKFYSLQIFYVYDWKNSYNPPSYIYANLLNQLSTIIKLYERSPHDCGGFVFTP